ncbi:MAG: SPOR domain-containing protein [Hydrogenobaculum sp.]
MKLKRTALLSLGAFIGFTLFYIGLNQWQHEKESTGKINIVTASPTPNQNASSVLPNSQAQTSQPAPTNIQQPQNPSTQTPQNQAISQPSSSTPSPSAQSPQTSTPKPSVQPQKIAKKSKPNAPKTITQIIKNSQKEENSGNVLFQIGAFKSQVALQRAISKARALGFEPMVKQEKGFYIVRVMLTNPNEGIKLLTAFPGAFRVR